MRARGRERRHRTFFRKAGGHVRPALLVILGVAAIIVVAWLFLRGDRTAALNESRLLLGTLVDIQGRFPRSIPDPTLGPVWDEISRIENIFSEHREASDISRVNRMAGTAPVRVSSEVFDLIRQAVGLASRTEGAFDPTWSALAADPEGWRIDPENPRVPSPEVIERLLALVDYRKVELNQEQLEVFLPEKGMALGLGGIAKGYAVDRAVEVLMGRGAVCGIVNAGGDLRAFGRPPGRKFWRIGVRDPFHPGEVIARLEIEEGAVTTSGNYERMVEVGGVRYHHIFDPRSGMPVRGLAGVTVAAPDALTADALATAVFVLGWDKGRELVEAYPRAEAVLVNEEGKRAVTSGLRGRVEFLDRKPRKGRAPVELPEELPGARRSGGAGPE